MDGTCEQRGRFIANGAENIIEILQNIIFNILISGTLDEERWFH